MQQGREEDRVYRRRIAENGQRAGGIWEPGEREGPEGSRDEPGQGIGNPEVLQTGRILLGPASPTRSPFQGPLFSISLVMCSLCLSSASQGPSRREVL